MKQLLLILLFIFVMGININAKETNTQNDILWKISGNKIKEPSYLFGTFHILSNAFTDTIAEVHEALQKTGIVVGEIVIDEAMQSKIMEASMLQGTNLKKLLPDSIYTLTKNWLKSETGMPIALFNKYNPMTIKTLAVAITQQKYFPTPKGYTQLDTYFQVIAKNEAKEIVGLETIDDQINILFKSISLERQIELLYEMVKIEMPLKEQVEQLYNAYLTQNMQELMQLMYKSSYSEAEIDRLLYNRNLQWMTKIPDLLNEKPAFMAVGALHLSGENGLVELLRKQGYTVTPIFIHL